MSNMFIVRRYIVERLGAYGRPYAGRMTAGMLYYCQAWTLVATGMPLFPNRAVKAHGGPSFRVDRKDERFYRRHRGDRPTPRETAIIDRVLHAFRDVRTDEWSGGVDWMIRSERPWRDAETGGEITYSSMLLYYSAIQADPGTPHVSPIPDLSDVADRTFIPVEDALWLIDRFGDDTD